MRLIDADVAYKVIADYYHHRTETQYKALKEAFSRVPTVNAEPIIRCKDCQWYERNELKRDYTFDMRYKKCFCTFWGKYRNNDGFCDNAQREDDA